MSKAILAVILAVLSWFTAESHADAEMAEALGARAYDRAEWPHWIDEDRDGQTTRQEVLAEESIVAPVWTPDERRVAAGVWICPFTGERVTNPHELDIDHLIPLAYAARHGGESWSRAQKRRFANDLSHPSHLVAVVARANRAKGSRGPASWMPDYDRCGYAQAWAFECMVHAPEGLACGLTDWRSIGRALREC